MKYFLVRSVCAACAGQMKHRSFFCAGALFLCLGFLSCRVLDDRSDQASDSSQSGSINCVDSLTNYCDAWGAVVALGAQGDFTWTPQLSNYLAVVESSCSKETADFLRNNYASLENAEADPDSSSIMCASQTMKYTPVP